MDFQELEKIAGAIVADGKGILAADESGGTIKKRFDSIGVESTEETRRAYRELLFTTEGAEEFIGGVILFDETIRQQASDGTPFPKLLESKGIIPGIKVDTGAKPLALAEGETVTEGLDGLRERLAEYRELGARFAKWRARDHDRRRTCRASTASGRTRTRSRAMPRSARRRPRPDRRAGSAHGRRPHDRAELRGHGRARCTRSSPSCATSGSHPKGILLKPNMVLPGYESSEQASDEEIAEQTIGCFRRHVPAAVPGIVFLSGGQSEEDATGA